MDLDIRKSDLVGRGVAVGLVLWFVAAVAAVDRSGTCWSNCDPDQDVVISFRPLGYWLAGLGTSICALLWTLALRRDPSPLRMLLWGVPAVIATGFWAAGLSLLR